MLALEVNFLTGRFVATQFNDRRRGEWPPHPARLFSTLVAACHASEPPDPAELAALDWLAAQGAPKVSASDASERELYTVFVPVNDPTVVGDFESARDELLESGLTVEAARAKSIATGGAGGERELSKLEKQHAKLSAGILGRIEKAIAARTAMSSGDVERGQSLLPEQRVKQARTFPSVSPDDPRVTFIWDDSKPDAGVIEALDRIAARVVRLGHSSTLVSVRLASEAPSPNWIPTDDGEVRLRIPLVNQLALLTEAFSRHRETEPRVMPAIPQRYGKPATSEASATPNSIFDESWIILRRSGDLALPCTAGPAVARAIRRVLLKYAPQPVAEVISGHGSDGTPTDQPHLAIIPLPFVGGKHADGYLMGIALLLPRTSTSDDRKAVYRALAAWESASRTGDEDTPLLPIHLGSVGSLQVRRLEDVPLQRTLQVGTWVGPARSWSTVTPIALDNHPGDLHANDPEKLDRVIAEASRSIAAACANIGLPLPDAVEILPAAPIAGSPKARHYPAFPNDPNRTRRALTHARVTFERPVRGPVILGAGRFVGLGLLRPEVADV